MLGLNLACRLNGMDTRVDALQDDLKIAEQFDFKAHPLNYHDGTWKAINLVYAGGETHYAHRGPDGMGIGEPEHTEVLKKCPYFTDIINRFNGLLKCKVKMARLSALPPGGQIHRHYDRIESVDFGMWRIHIPITTHPDVKFYLGFRRRRWNPGEVWVGDFTFPHSIHNASAVNRVHMIIDLEHVSERVLNWLPKGHMSEKAMARRAWLRERHKWIDWQLDKLEGRKDRSGRRDTAA